METLVSREIQASARHLSRRMEISLARSWNHKFLPITKRKKHKMGFSGNAAKQNRSRVSRRCNKEITSNRTPFTTEPILLALLRRFSSVAFFRVFLPLLPARITDRTSHRVPETDGDRVVLTKRFLPFTRAREIRRVVGLCNEISASLDLMPPSPHEREKNEAESGGGRKP